MHPTATHLQADTRADRIREALALAVEELNSDSETDPACRIELRCQIEELRDALRLLETEKR